MKRSITGAMFYYHEGAYFTSDKARSKVERWEEKPLTNLEDEESLKIKFLREIKNVTQNSLPKDKLNFIEPYRIEYDIQPLFFYCVKCGWNIHFKKSVHLLNYLKDKELKCKVCKNSLIQAGHVFACQCTKISDIKEKFCRGTKKKAHKNKKMDFERPSLYDVRTWKFICKICGSEKPLEMYCSNCRNRMSLKPTEGSGLTTPLAFTTPSFTTPNYKWIAEEYLGIDMSKNEKQTIKSISDESGEIEHTFYKNKVKNFVKKRFDDYNLVLERLTDFTAIRTNVDQTESTPFGITFHRTDKINLVKGVYAYIVNAFKPELGKTNFKFFIRDGNYNILTNKISNTEGIIIEFDRNKVLDWLYKNNFIDEVPSSKVQKIWFIENGLSSESHIEVQKNLYGRIYSLLHTVSHGLMVSMSTISGMSIDSVSELIFPEIPAVLLYTSDSNSIGHLESLFENMLDEWISKTKEDTMQYCIHDPLCIQGDHACAGCLMISEIVCSNFNNSLDRRYVIGGNGIKKGFWE